MSNGPEKRTLIEMFVQVIPLKYTLAALAWTIVLGPIGFRLAEYLEFGPQNFSLSSPNPYNEVVGVLLIFYLFYIVRYLRLRVVGAEPHINPIMQGGDAAYRSVFGRLSSNRFILSLTLVLEVLALIATRPYRGGISILSLYNVATQFVLVLAFATLIWEYSLSSWGLHELGRSRLRLKSFLEDRFMGVRPIGSLALSTSVAYLVGLALFFLDSATFLPVLTPAFAGFFLAMLALGVVLFFLPLNSLHRRMMAEKTERQTELNHQLLTIKGTNIVRSGIPSTASSTSIEKLESAIEGLVRLKDIEITERKLAGTPTWPFDIQLLARLITIVLSVTAVILARLITNFLHI